LPTLAELRQFARYHLIRRVHDHPARETELGVVSLGYDPEAFEREVRACGDRFEIREAMRVSYRGTSRPVLDVRTRDLASARTRLLVLSGVHGNEHAGIVCVPAILARFAAEAPAGVGLVALTPVNPIGAAELSRFNAEGYDINRDFVRFDTPEARLVRDTMDAVRPDFVISLHEGPQDAAFMFANAHVSAALATRLLSALEAGGTTLATHDYFGARLRTPGLSPSTPAARAVVSVWAATLGMRATIAFSELRGIPELVLESSWRGTDREARVRPHVDLCMAVARELGQKPSAA
jgi:predicted deacylase